MNKFFDDLPIDTMRQTFKLVDHYETAILKKNLKITDFFFCWTKESGFTFIQKNSLEGHWTAFKTGLKRKFFSGDDSLTIERNLEKVADLFEKAARVKDDRFFKQASGSKDSQDSDPRVRVNALGVQLISLTEHVNKSRIEKRQITTKVPIHSQVERVSQEFFGDRKKFSSDVKTLLKDVLDDKLTDEESDEIVCLLSSHVDAGAIIKALGKGKEDKTSLEALEPLQLALIKALAYVSEERVGKIIGILRKIQIIPETISLDTDEHQLKAFAIQFGDRFIKGTKLEGNMSPRPYAQLVSEYIAKRGMKTPLSMEIKDLLDKAINLADGSISPETLIKDIKEILAKSSHERKKCLLFGGWSTHAILYEIEEQSNGKYTFRIYNKGGGAEHHDTLQAQYKDQVAGCIAIKDIEGKKLFNHSFIASLQEVSHLSSQEGVMDVKPYDLLLGYLLPMLGGELAISDERVQHFLDEQLSGTCTYATLQACLAHQMSAEEFTVFECDYKTYLLKHYYPQLVKSAEAKIKCKEDYQNTLLHYSVIKRSLEEFSKGIDEAKSIIPDDMIETASIQIMRCQAELSKLHGQLIDYEKKLYTNALVDLKTVPFELNPPVEVEPSSEQKSVISEDSLELIRSSLLQMIQDFSSEQIELMSSKEEDFLKNFAEASEKITASDFHYIADVFFKQLGSLDRWNSIQFNDPSNAMANLKIISSLIFKDISREDKSKKVDNYLLFLSFSHGLEVVFKQCKPEQRVLTMDKYLPLLASPNIQKKLDELRCSNPFWVSTIREMKTLGSQDISDENQLFFDVSLSNPNLTKEERKFKLNDQIVSEICSWWKGDFNQGLREKVNESAKRDRIAQDLRIKKEIEKNKKEKTELNKKIEKLNEEISKVDDSIKIAGEGRRRGAPKTIEEVKDKVDEWLSKLDSIKIEEVIDKVDEYLFKCYERDLLKQGVDRCDCNINGLANEVKKDRQYWPEKFEGSLSNTSRATFLFCPQEEFFQTKVGQDDLLPNEFRLYCDFLLLTNNVFDKFEEGGFDESFVTSQFSYEINDKKQIKHLDQLLRPSRSPLFHYEHRKLEHDPYVMSIVDHEDDFDEVYKNVFCKRTQETEIPYQVEDDEIEKMASDKSREIFAIRSAPDMQIRSTLSYFEEHMEDLSENNNVNLFHSLLFESDLLMKELEDKRKRALIFPKLRNFFSLAIKNAMHLEEYDTAANMCWIASNVQQYLDFVAKSSKDEDTSLKLFDDSTLILKLINDAFQSKKRDQWPVVCEAILACFEDANKLPLDMDWQKRLMICGDAVAFIYERGVVNEKNYCFPRSAQANLALKALSDMTEVLEVIQLSQKEYQNYIILLLNSVYPNLIREDFIVGDGVAIKAKDLNLNALQVHLGELSEKIKEILVDYLEIYPRTADLSKLRSFFTYDDINIRDPDMGVEIRINGLGKVYIKTPEMDFWCEHLYGEAKNSLFYKKSLESVEKTESTDSSSKEEEEKIVKKELISIELCERYHHRQKDKIIYLCDRDSQKPLYKADLSEKPIFLKHIQIKSEKKALILCEPSKSTLFASFEDPTCISFWGDEEGNICQIDFSRLNITLMQEEAKEGSRWVFAEQKEWFLAKEQFAPHFGQNSGFLVFQNEQGQKKVILPIWTSKESEEIAPLNNPYQYDFSALVERNGRFIECDLIGNKLKPCSREARFYLAKIYLEKGFIDLAEELLFAHEAELSYKKYSKKERERLYSLVIRQDSKDIGARNLKIRFHALYLLEKNDSQFSSEIEQKKKTSSSSDGNTSEYSETGRKITLIHDYLTRVAEIARPELREELLVLSKMYSLEDTIKISNRESFKDKVVLAFKLMGRRIQELEGNGEFGKSIIRKSPSIAALKPNEYKPNKSFHLREFRGLLSYVLPRFFFKIIPAYFKKRFPLLFAEKYFQDVYEYDGEFDSYVPNWKDKIRYRRSRWFGTFPFHPHRVDAEGLKNYYQLLKRECETTTKWEKARENGLLQAIYYMALFAKDDVVKSSSEGLLRTLMMNIGDSRYRNLLDGRSSVMPLTYLSNETRIIQGFHDLIMLELKTFSANGETFLSDQSEIYLTKVNSEKIEISSTKIFHENYPEATDHTIKMKFKEVAEDIDEAKLFVDHYAVTEGKDLKDLEKTLLKAFRKENEHLEQQLFAITNSVVSALIADSGSYMQFVSKERQYPTIEELCIVCARKNYHAYAKKLYPELSRKGRENLKNSVISYLKQKRLVNHIQRCLVEVREVAIELQGEDSSSKQIAIDGLKKMLNEHQSYDEFTDKEEVIVLMLIETTLNITLRPDQIYSIKTFVAALKEGRQVAIQDIMGSGKTAIQQPALAFFITLLYDDLESLSTVIVPDSLVETVKEGLANTLGSAFKQYIFFAPYERSLAKDCAYLQTFLDRLIEAKEQGNCVLFTSRQKHSIITSLYEAFYEYGNNKDDEEIQERVVLIAEICDFLQIHEVDQIDEIDLIMNPNIIFKYPIGNKEAINFERADILSEILLELAEDKDISKKVSLDFIDAFQKRKNKSFVKKGACLTEERFIDIVQPKLVDIAEKLLKKRRQIFNELKDEKSYICYFLTQTTPFDAEVSELCMPIEEAKIGKDLRGLSQEQLEKIEKPVDEASNEEKARYWIVQKRLFKKSMLAWIRENIEDENDRDLLGVCAHAIANVLPKTLFKECGVHYGKDPQEGKYISRPYFASNAPKTTIDEDPYKQVLLTAQQTLFYGLPADAIGKILIRLQKRAKVLMRKSGCLLKETKAYQKFEKLLGKEKAEEFNLLESPPSEKLIEAFRMAAGRDSRAIQEFMERYAFEQIALFSKSLSSTPQTLTGSSRLTCGYTGTLATGILSLGTEALSKKGTDGKTITAVQKKMDDKKSSVINISEKKDLSLPEQLISFFLKDADLFVLIDSGGWLKEEVIDEYVERLLLACEKSDTRKTIKSIQYHDAKGTIISIERDLTSGKIIRMPFKYSRYESTQGTVLTIIAQKFETGTNIPQKPNAKAYETIRKNMTLRDVLQSLFRMRQILLGQSASELLSDEIREHICISIVEALLMNKVFKVIFSKESKFDENAIDKVIGMVDLPLEAEELSKSLKKALKAYVKLSKERKENKERTQKEAISEFLTCFLKEYNPDSDALWRYFAVNQSKAEQEDSWMAGKQKMKEVIEKPLRMTLEDNKLSLKDRLALFNAFNEIFIQQTNDAPFENIIKENVIVDAKTAISEEIAGFMKIYSHLKDKDVPSNVREVVHGHIKALYGKDSKKTDPDEIIEDILGTCVKEEDIADVVKGKGSSSGVNVEADIENELEVEQEKEKEIERIEGKLHSYEYQGIVNLHKEGGYVMTEFFDSNLEKYSLNNFVTEYLDFGYQDSLYCSPNLIFGMIGSAFHGAYHIPGRYLLALSWDDAKERRYFLVSHEDAALIEKGLYQSKLPSGSHAGLFYLNGGLVFGENNCEEVFKDEMHQCVLVQAKLMTGKITFTEEEITRLKKMIESDLEQGIRLKRVYENIIKYCPNTFKQYPETDIFRLFNFLK